MSRFSRLEFGKKRSPKGLDAQGEPIRDAAYYHERATSLWLAGDFEGALQAYSRALEDNNAFYEGWFGQVRMLIELGEYHEAMLWAGKALELFPEHPELLAAKAVASARDVELDKAQAFSDNSISKEGVTWYVWLARAEILLLKRGRMAENCIRNALSIAGNDMPIARLEAGRILRRSGDYASAMEYLATRTEELSKSALAWYELGRCQAALGLPEAENTLGQCIRLRPYWNEAKEAFRRFDERGLFCRIREGCRRFFRR